MEMKTRTSRCCYRPTHALKEPQGRKYTLAEAKQRGTLRIRKGTCITLMSSQ